MRILRFILGASLLSLGCQADGPEATGASEAAETDAPATSTTTTAEDDEAARIAAGRSCDDLQESAGELLGSYQSCDEDADCTLAAIPAACLGAFVCQPAVAKDAKLDALRRKARALSALYQARCEDQCIVARCVAPDQQRAYCDAASKRCAVAYAPAPRVDAQVPEPEPTSDAGTPTDPTAGDPRYQCRSDDDCAVKDVGNCCGTYPRCANVAATFERPSCEGHAGVCGFPSIESCACRESRCRSLQDGREI